LPAIRLIDTIYLVFLLRLFEADISYRLLARKNGRSEESFFSGLPTETRTAEISSKLKKSVLRRWEEGEAVEAEFCDGAKVAPRIFD
jgi:hypothetical protein